MYNEEGYIILLILLLTCANDGVTSPEAAFNTIAKQKSMHKLLQKEDRGPQGSPAIFFAKIDLVDVPNDEYVYLGVDLKMENNNIEEAIKLNIESWNKVGFPIPEAYKNWCIEHGREDLLDGNKPNLSAESAFLPVPSRAELAGMFGLELSAISSETLEEPVSEEDINSMLNLALEAMARDLGIEIPEGIITGESREYDKNGELPSMEEIFGMKRKE